MVVVFLVATTVLIVIVVAAPAAWVAGWLADRGSWRLVHAEGSLWRGSASVGIEDRGVVHLLPGSALGTTLRLEYPATERNGFIWPITVRAICGAAARF